MNYEALRSLALLHAGKARKMAAKLFNDPQASQVDAGDLLISMAQLVDLLCVAATPAPAPDAEQLRLAGLTLIGLAEHDQHCDVFDLDDEGKHKDCTCGFDGAIAVITQAGKMAATPAPAPLTDEQIDKTAKRVIPVAAYMGMFEYAAFSKEDADRTVRHFARAIEAAHGIGASTKESKK